MSMLQSRNPAMRVLENEDVLTVERQSLMTIGGTVTATSILLSIVAAVGVLTYQNIAAGGVLTGYLWPITLGGAFGGIIVSLIIYRKPKSAKFIAPIHAAFEGLFVGALSYLIPAYFLSRESGQANAADMQSLVFQAVLATFAIAGAMLAGYATGILRVGPLVQKIIITAGMGLGLYVVVLFALRLFGIDIWNGFMDSGPIGIGFTLLCVGLASLYLIMDFQFVEEGVNARAPKYMEWVGAWALMITLVWLYIEVLRLLAKLRSSE